MCLSNHIPNREFKCLTWLFIFTQDLFGLLDVFARTCFKKGKLLFYLIVNYWYVILFIVFTLICSLQSVSSVVG